MLTLRPPAIPTNPRPSLFAVTPAGAPAGSDDLSLAATSTTSLDSSPSPGTARRFPRPPSAARNSPT